MHIAHSPACGHGLRVLSADGVDVPKFETTPSGFLELGERRSYEARSCLSGRAGFSAFFGCGLLVGVVIEAVDE